ncbi:MAG: prepilin-type N-terminal cleavage/methylation domain-containing protein [Pseudomonadota bacterium]
MRVPRHDPRGGFTLVEVLVAVGILAMVSAMVYGSVSVTLRSQRLVMKTQEVYHAGRVSLTRMARDLSCAFLSKHVGVMERVTETIFKGSDDDLVFTYLCHTRVFPTRPESDQGVVSYFLKSGSGKGKTLVRKEKAWIDDRPEREGDELVLAEGVKKLDIEYWDVTQEDWTDSWKAELEDTEPIIQDVEARKTQKVLQKVLTGEEQDEDFRLPTRIRITLVLLDEWGEDYTFETQVELRMKEAFQW